MTLLSAIPGLDLRVSEVNSTLSEMWQVSREEGEQEHALFRASQMNLIIHFGMTTTPEEARTRFDTAIRFGQKHPCRVIMLCPVAEREGDELLQAKLFTQCYIGSSMREMCCCEVLGLSYPTRAFVHLRNQVSVWLEADLPTYHWFHRVPARRIQDQYLDFIKPFRRILMDRDVEGSGYDEIPWPRRERVHDIAQARLLSVKQALGPTLSNYSPAQLADGLEGIRFGFAPDVAGQGEYLKRWVLGCLRGCYTRTGKKIDDLAVEVDAAGCEHTGEMRMEWRYTNGKQFLWTLQQEEAHASIRAGFGGGLVEFSQVVQKIGLETALSEALFF